MALSSGQLLIWQKQQTNETEVTYSTDVLKACERQCGSLPKRCALVCLDVAVTGVQTCAPSDLDVLFQYRIILPFHTVHGVLKARILKWFAIPFSSGPVAPHGMA